MSKTKAIPLKTQTLVVIKTPKYLRRVPEHLVYEWLNGKPIYYRGYKNVLSGKLKSEDIMGSSRIQAFFISLIVERLLPHLLKTHKIFYSEMGVHISAGNNLSTDIAIYRRSDLTPQWLMQDTYADLPPLVVIEVDTKAAPESVEDFNVYFTDKMQKYLDFGVEKVVWIFTKTKKIWIAEKGGQPWLIVNCDYQLTVLNEKFTIEQLIKDYGFDPTQLIMNQ